MEKIFFTSINLNNNIKEGKLKENLKRKIELL